MANGTPLTVMSCGAESDGQMKRSEECLEPGGVRQPTTVSVSGGRLKLNELKIVACSSCGRSWEYVPQQLPCPAMWLLNAPRRQHADRRDVVVQGQADLLQVVDALDAPGRLACGLDGGQKQGDQTAMMAMTTSSSISVKARRMPARFSWRCLSMKIKLVRVADTSHVASCYDRVKEDLLYRLLEPDTRVA